MSGFYFDDYITDNSFGDPYPMMAEDMGITKPIQHQLALDYARVMDTVYTEVLARGMFSWQQLWNGQGSPSDKNGCCTGPLVEPYLRVMVGVHEAQSMLTVALVQSRVKTPGEDSVHRPVGSP